MTPFEELTVIRPFCSPKKELLERLKANGTKTSVEPYDMDKLNNPHVENKCLKLIDLCVKHGFGLKRLRWDPAYKGIDDFLYAK